jgi:hypothetical protein
VKPDQPLKRWAIVWSPSGAFAGGGARATQAKKINKVRRGPHRRSARARWVATPGRKQASPAAIRNDKGFIGTDGGGCKRNCVNDHRKRRMGTDGDR